jgi:hypothetical protein
MNGSNRDDAAKYLLVGRNKRGLGTAPAKELPELTEEVHQMKRFAPLMLTAAAMASLAGCAAQSGSPNEMTAEDSAALCANPDGTNAGIAALATAITQELHRWQITSDFYIYNGYNNQQMLGLTSSGLMACGGSCPMTQNILNMQDSRMDQKVIFDGTKMSSWSFASRLVTGYYNQKSCQQNNQCPFVAHVFGWQSDGTYNGFSSAPGACDTLFTFNVNLPSAQNHAPLTSAQMSQLSNALVWTTGNGPNPYIAFQTGASTVSIDPTGSLNPPGQTTGSDTCQKFSLINLNGQACTCAANNIYSNGQLWNIYSQTPMTYYCVQK